MSDWTLWSNVPPKKSRNTDRKIGGGQLNPEFEVTKPRSYFDGGPTLTKMEKNPLETFQIPCLRFDISLSMNAIKILGSSFRKFLEKV